MDEINKQVSELIEAGVLIKDVDRGLIDWYAKKGKRDIFLCWKIGDEKIQYWHEVEDGFSGRKPISQL